MFAGVKCRRWAIGYGQKGKAEMAMKMKKFLCVVMILGLFSFLFGCGKQQNPTDSGTSQVPEVIVPRELPEGVSLTGLFMNETGMRMMPYYILKTTDDGTYMKITDHCPEDYFSYGGESSDGVIQPAQYFGYVETVRDDEYASLIKLQDDTLIRKLEECIAKYGALGWDGYEKSVAMPDVLDSGTNYQLYLELSDSTKVKVHGYNACPAGFKELLHEVTDIFQENSDYSRYMASNFKDSPCEYMQVDFYGTMIPETYYKLSFRKNMNQWTVALRDDRGVILEAGTNIAENKNSEKELPFERFLNIMSKYRVEEWNGYSQYDSSIIGHFNILMYFEDGKKFDAHGNGELNGFETFKQEFIAEICRFYTEMESENSYGRRSFDSDCSRISHVSPVPDEEDKLADG